MRVDVTGNAWSPTGAGLTARSSDAATLPVAHARVEVLLTDFGGEQRRVMGSGTTDGLGQFAVSADLPGPDELVGTRARRCWAGLFVEVTAGDGRRALSSGALLVDWWAAPIAFRVGLAAAYTPMENADFGPGQAEERRAPRETAAVPMPASAPKAVYDAWIAGRSFEGLRWA